MKKVLIVQPVEGLSQEEKKNTLNEACQYLTSKEFEPIFYTSPLIEENIANTLGIKNTYLYYISNMFDYMSKVDCVYFTDGWLSSKDCRVIRLAAVLYDIEILSDNEITNKALE